MNRDIAIPAEDDEVFILIVTVITDAALSILLSHQGSLVGTQVLETEVIYLTHTTLTSFLLLYLSEYIFILQVVLLLLH